MTPAEMKRWTFETSLRTIEFVRALPRGEAEYVLRYQLLKSGTSVPAQNRAACRAQSTLDFISKMKRMEEEADESALWLALLRGAGLPQNLHRTSEELESVFSRFTAIAVQSVKTSRERLARDKTARRMRRTTKRDE